MIYLHLGVHKTATTYIQDLFELNQGRIASAGRAYWTRGQFRPLFQWGLRAGDISGRRRAVKWLLKPRVERAFVKEIQALLGVSMPSIISEENVIGRVADSLEGKSYIHARTRLNFLSKIIGGREVEIWLCLRDYAGFLSSQYAEALRQGYDVQIAQFVAANRVADGRWRDLVSDIHQVFPQARIVVWRYEDFAQHKSEIVERLAGLPLDAMRPLVATEVRPSPSRQAVEVQSECAASMKLIERRMSMIMLEDKFSLRDYPEKFDPWDDETRAAMNAAYARDVTEVAARDYVELLGAA